MFFKRYLKNQFQDTFSATIGINKEIKHVKVGNDCYKLTLWDSTGAERLRSLPKKYYQKANGFLLLFDVTNKDSFNNVEEWIKDVKNNSNKNIGGENGTESKIPLYLIGNKIDSPYRVITKEQAQTKAKSLGMKYFEVSCKYNMNISEVMNKMIMDTYMKADHIENCFKLSAKKSGKEHRKRGGLC